MKQTKLSVTGTGDSLFVAKFPEEYTKYISSVADFIKSCDIRMTNLETNLSDFEYYGSAYSGGTWLNTRREYIKELFRYGFQFFGTANNHVMDYSYGGLLSTIDTLDKYGVAHAGTGRSLEEASKPAILEANGAKVAIFALDTSFDDPSRAGRATRELKARPGVNYLRHTTAYHITKEQEQQLCVIAAETRINAYRELSIATGFLPPDPEGFFMLGNQKFTTRDDVPLTSCHKGDKERLLHQFRQAKSECDYVFLLCHCHDDDGVREANPPAYLIEFAHAAIDAGVSAIFGGGCHSLRGIEIYKDCPIFYSLGDFIYQGLKVEYLPADFMEKYGIDIYSTAAQALYARSRGNTVGLHCDKANYQTVLPRLEFENGKLMNWSLLPVYLTFDRKDDMNGLPQAAEGAEAQEIYKRLSELSAPYGVRLKLENGKILPD